MKGFIEVASKDGEKHMINVSSITLVAPAWVMSGVEIQPCTIHVAPHHHQIHVVHSYDEVISMMAEAMK